MLLLLLNDEPPLVLLSYRCCCCCYFITNYSQLVGRHTSEPGSSAAPAVNTTHHLVVLITALLLLLLLFLLPLLLLLLLLLFLLLLLLLLLLTSAQLASWTVFAHWESCTAASISGTRKLPSCTLTSLGTTCTHREQWEQHTRHVVSHHKPWKTVLGCTNQRYQEASLPHIDQPWYDLQSQSTRSSVQQML
jgi:hypothetical protein